MDTKNITYTGKISEYAFIAYFFILSFFPFGADIIKLLCLLTMAGCLAYKMIQERRLVFEKTSINIPILLYFIWLIATSVHSENKKYCFETILHDYVSYFIIFFCMVNTINSIDQIKRIVRAMLITCGLICGYGLYGYYTGIAIRDDRLVATFEYHCRIAIYISLLFPFVVCLFFYYKNILIRFCLAILIFVCCFSLVLTMSRSGWIATTVAIFIILFAIQKKYLIFVFVGIGALLFVMIPAKYTKHAQTITQYNEFFSSKKIIGDRLICWKASLAMISDHPLFGLGPGKRNFRNVYKQYRKKIQKEKGELQTNSSSLKIEKKKIRKKEKLGEVEVLSHAHNVFLQILVETGIVGLSIFLWMFIKIFYVTIRTWKITTENKYEKMLILSIKVSLISIFCYGMADNIWKTPESLFLWYVIGVLFLIIRFVSNGTDIISIYGGKR